MHVTVTLGTQSARETMRKREPPRTPNQTQRERERPSVDCTNISSRCVHATDNFSGAWHILSLVRTDETLRISHLHIHQILVKNRMVCLYVHALANLLICQPPTKHESCGCVVKSEHCSFLQFKYKQILLVND